jgi:hypothetical protein
MKLAGAECDAYLYRMVATTSRLIDQEDAEAIRRHYCEWAGDGEGQGGTSHGGRS